MYSAAAVVKNGRVYLYYSGLEAVGDTPVDSDIRLAESSNGVSFGNHCDLIRGTDGDPGHDEIFPLGAIELNDNWHVYWSNRANSSYPDWAMMYSSGSSPGNIGSIGQARRIRAPSSGKLTSFGDPIRISDTEIMVPVKTNFGTNESIDFLTAPVSNPGNLSRRSTVRWSGLLHGTLYLDREEGQWLLYYYRSTRQRPAEVKDSSGYI